MRPLNLVVVSLLATALSNPAYGTADESADQRVISAIENEVVVLTRKGEAPVTTTLAKRMAELRVPGVSVAYFQNGRIRWARAYGSPVAGSGRSLIPAVRFQAASLSKPVAAVLALQLVDRGKFALDDDVRTRIQSWRIPDTEISSAPITLRQLLSHTAGLSLSGYPGYPRGARLPTIVQSLQAASPANTPAVTRIARPGASFNYSGGGYSVTQLLLSEGTGQPFQYLARKHLFRPLRMNRSSFEQPLSNRDARDAAAGHDAKGDPIAGGARVYPELAAAGLWTTPSDYARFVIALQLGAQGSRGPILSLARIAEMTKAVTNEQGLGVRVVRRNGRISIAHGGSNEGFRCQFVGYLDGPLEGAVVMTNGENGGALIGHVLRTLEVGYGWDRGTGRKP